MRLQTSGGGAHDPHAPPAHVSVPVEEQDVTQPVRSTPAETTVASSARSGAGQTTATEGADHQKDRFVPVRLLVILVIAALIGSAVVLLLK